MKPLHRVLALLAWVVIVGRVNSLSAREERVHPEFDKLKALEGVWSGPAVWDQGGQKGNVEFEISYRVTSGGKAVLETMMPGTPGEMVTVYHLDGENLVLVHYCNSGNQPRMKLEPSSDGNDLPFRCLGGNEHDGGGLSHALRAASNRG